MESIIALEELIKENEEKVVHLRKVHFHPWDKQKYLTLALVEDYQTIVAKSLAIRNESLQIALAILLLSLVVVGLLSRLFTTPLRSRTLVIAETATTPC